MKHFSIIFWCSLFFIGACQKPDAVVNLTKGMVINQSILFQEAYYQLPGSDDSLTSPVITVKGDNLELDFNGIVLDGGSEGQLPNTFSGLGLLIRNSKNVTIRNLTIKGYKVALLAENVDSLKIVDCNFSYNYRQKLHSIRERENLADWLSYHDNEKDEWLRYGAAIYLKSCDHALVKGVKVTGGQNGLMLTACDNGLFYNNQIQFNSGVGIGLYRSGNNRVLHNQLDWNVRGYSHGFYRRGQDSAGILCYEQSSNNVFAYNSATHSGDGFFLWAGNTTMETGEGGCNGNLLFANDFSHAPTNGIEVTFSSNTIVNNRLEECNYGVWGGYSWNTTIAGNYIANNENGVAIEHGQDNRIQANFFENNERGIQLWARENQPPDWGYAQAKDVRSRDYSIEENTFVNHAVPLEISSTRQIKIKGNQWYGFEQIMEEKKPNQEVTMDNNVSLTESVPSNPLQDHTYDFSKWISPPEHLPDGITAALPDNHPRGRSFILVDEWGPYDFGYPSIWLRDIKEDGTYVFLLMGPSSGNWKVVDGNGFTTINPKTGAFPTTLTAKREAQANHLNLQFEFVGEAFTNQFGQLNPKGRLFPFQFSRYESEMEWTVKWYAYDPGLDPESQYEAIKAVLSTQADHQLNTKVLDYRWWGSPGAGLPPDHFATFASSQAVFEPGNYQITMTSDDGLRFYVDGKMLIDRWNIHEPAVDQIEVELNGMHLFEIEHFEKTGLATLDFRIEKLN